MQENEKCDIPPVKPVQVPALQLEEIVLPSHGHQVILNQPKTALWLLDSSCLVAGRGCLAWSYHCIKSSLYAYREDLRRKQPTKQTNKQSKKN